MSAVDDEDDTSATENTSFDNAFTGGTDAAALAEETAQAINAGIPGAVHGSWDESAESVTGSASGFMRGEEAGRDPFGFRQIPHEFLRLNEGFLIPHLQGFQAVAAQQLDVVRDPTSTAGQASSTMDQAYQSVDVEIDEKDHPTISARTEALLNQVRPRPDDVQLIASGLEGWAMDVVLDPPRDKVYVITSAGNLYVTALAGGTKRKVATSGALGNACGLALDGQGGIYVGDKDGRRLLRVDLSTGHTETLLTGVSVFGIGLAGDGRAYVTDQENGRLIEVLLAEGNRTQTIADGLGATTSAATLTTRGTAYTGHWNSGGPLWEVNLATRAKSKVPTDSFTGYSCDIALDGEDVAYVSDPAKDCLYKISLDSDVQAKVVGSRSGNFSASGVALDSDNGMVYVSTWEGQLWRFSVSVLRNSELIEVTTGV